MNEMDCVDVPFAGVLLRQESMVKSESAVTVIGKIEARLARRCRGNETWCLVLDSIRFCCSVRRCSDHSVISGGN